MFLYFQLYLQQTWLYWALLQWVPGESVAEEPRKHQDSHQTLDHNGLRRPLLY